MKFLVPYDFSPITRTSLDHALSIQSQVGGDIELLHIIGSEKDRAEAEGGFTQLLDALDDADRAKVGTKVRVGDIYTDIAKEADEGDHDLLIMGTHGAKGFQKLFGSRALKVITSAQTPFIVTQKKGPEDSIKKIVMPIDLQKESVQIIRFAADLAERFESEIHLVTPQETDEWLLKKIQTNIYNAKDYLDKRGVRYQVNEVEGDGSFGKEVIDYGAKYRADMFAITYFTESILPQFETFAQDIITNKFEIPTLIVNTVQVDDINTNFTFIGM